MLLQKTKLQNEETLSNTYIVIISKLQKVNDAYEIEKILLENDSWDNKFEFNKKKELFQFAKFTAQMLFAFPLGLIMRKIIRKNKKLNTILQFPELKSIRSNIEKGSFAYDTILFKQNPLQIIQNKSHLANLVCLSLLFGDEFIDGIATEYGKENIQKVLKNKEVNYYLQSKKINNEIILYYEFDICNVLPKTVLLAQNQKYDITYAAFYNHLQFLLNEINLHLNKLPKHIIEEAVLLICKVCNKCFDTYKTDVQDYTIQYNWNTLLNYQQSKDDEIVTILLELRAILLQKNKPKYQQHFVSWAMMVRSMQIYDDMQDVASDCTYQMNFLVYFAKEFFIEEWHWLQLHKNELLQLNNLQVQQQIALNMPASMQYCLQYNKNITFKNLNWVQQKIQNYLWRKNWLCIDKKLKPNNEDNIDFNTLQTKLLQYNSSNFNNELQYAQILDIIMLHNKERKKLFSIITKSERYILMNNYTSYATYKKSILAKRYLALINQDISPNF